MKNIKLFAFLAIFLLSAAVSSAWATDVTLTYRIEVQSTTTLKPVAHIYNAATGEEVASWDHGVKTLWPANEGHSMNDGYGITFTPNQELDKTGKNENNKSTSTTAFSTEKIPTTFTVSVGKEGFYFKSVTFKEDNTEKASSSNIAPNSTSIGVRVPANKFFNYITVVLTVDAYAVSVPENLTISNAFATINRVKYYKSGETVTLTAKENEIINTITGVTASNENVTINLAADRKTATFKMPSEDVAITATTAEVYTVSVPDGITLSDAFINISGTDYYKKGQTVTFGFSGSGSVVYFVNGERIEGNSVTVGKKDLKVEIGIPYIDENGKEQIRKLGEYTVLTSLTDVSNLGGGWYVVQGKVKYSNQVKFSGDAHLILADGAEMVIESKTYGIQADKNLTIYGQNGQSDQSGTLKVTATGLYGINSEKGNITISGGTVTASGSNDGIYGSNGVTISGGTVMASGYTYGIYSSNGVTINGGIVTATGKGGSGIYSSNGVTINGVTINGGIVTATGYNGIYSDNGVSINGGSVTATGTNRGIYSYNGVTINGGSVTATCGYGNGIYSQNRDIILGWTNSTDFIKASSYSSYEGSVQITEGKSFKDEKGNVYSGTITGEQLSAIKGKKLEPAKPFPDNMVIADIPDQIYTGDSICPMADVTMPAGVDPLVKGEDYKVVCKENLNAGTATLSVQGVGIYYGEIKKTFTIAKAPLTITAKDKTIAYGDEPANDGVEYEGFVGEENASVLGGKLMYSYNYKKLDKVGEYTITPSGLTSGNYEITFAAGTLTVEKADISVDALAAKEKLVYNGEAQELVTAGETNFGTLLYSLDGKKYSSEVPTAIEAKTYTVYYKVAEGDNWNALAKTIEVVIAKAPLTVTAKDKSIVYGDEPANDGVEYSGFIGEENASVLGGELTYSYNYQKLDKVGKYTITPSGLTAGNYEITFAAGTLTVEIAAVSVEAPVAEEKLVYSGKAQELVTAGNANFGTLLYSLDGEKYSAEIPTATDAKTYTVYYKVAESDNWNAFEAKTIEVVIAKAPLTVTAKDKSIVYGNEPANDGVEYSGFIGEENASVLGGELSYSYNYQKLDKVGEYTITPSGLTAGNYEITYAAGTLTVEIAAVSVDAPVAEEKLAYNGKAQELVTAGKTNFGMLLYSLDGEKYSAEIPAATDAKTYTVYYKVEGSDNWNAFEAKKVEVVIAKAPLTVTAKDKSIVYGNEPANDGVEYSGFIGEENESVLGGELSYSYNYQKLDKVGKYTITPSGLTAGNYEISFVAGTLTVKKADVSVEAPVAKEKLVYSGKSQELVTAGKTNFGTLLYSLDGEKYSAEIPAATDAKTYTVYYKVEGSDNWNAFEAKKVEVVIAKAPLTVTAKDKSIVYGNEPANDGVEYSGFIGEENASVLGGELSYSCSYKKLDKAGEYTITPSGLTSGNYEITFAAGTLTVKKADISVEALAAKEKLFYNGKSQELVTAGKTNFGTLLYSLDGKKYSSEIPTATDAKTYTVYYKVEGSDNWNAFEAKTIEVVIAKAPLTVTAKDKSIVYGNEPANDGVEYSGFIGEENESVLGGELSYSYSYKKLDKVGEYTITPSGLTAGNYEITFAAGTLTVEIAAVSVEAPVAKEKLVYSGKAQELVTAGKTNFGTLLYSLDGEKFSAEIPVATDAKTYTVYYKVEGSDNWNAFEAKKVEVKIAKAEVSVEAPVAKEKLAYSGKSQELVTAGKTNFGTLLYSLDGEKYSAEIPAATDAKTYTVYYKVEGSDNWNAFEAKKVEVKIEKTSAIGRMSPRAVRVTRAVDRSFDLKGRPVRGSSNARGAYYKK